VLCYYDTGYNNYARTVIRVYDYEIKVTYSGIIDEKLKVGKRE
jgi:hypothetical protein